MGVVPEAPWTTGRQCHRDNPEHASAEEYYRRIITIPFLDNIVSQMRNKTKFCSLVPSILGNGNPISFDDLLSFYKEDLLLSLHVLRCQWRVKWEGQGAEDRPATLRTAIKACDKDIFPNVYALLQLGCTLPVTSCENE